MIDEPHDERALRMRHYEPPRSGFEQRILAAARHVTQQKQPRLRDILKLIFGEIAAPRLQFAYAVVLSLGIALGFSAPMNQSHDSAVQTFLNDDGANL